MLSEPTAEQSGGHTCYWARESLCTFVSGSQMPLTLWQILWSFAFSSALTMSVTAVLFPVSRDDQPHGRFYLMPHFPLLSGTRRVSHQGTNPLCLHAETQARARVQEVRGSHLERFAGLWLHTAKERSTVYPVFTLTFR